ncbi:efflux RND transporter permease subunit [Massilia putida]|uniref:efflux RND transporter permease subunit n=1 Tax=Massilia putida TaxID=1141883 RepID=UPI000952E279|nr:efflux RND transporter permease subunit [Massilia putida]
MNISALSIKHPVPAILLFILLTMAGLLGFRELLVQDAPDIEAPSIGVTTALPGASPPQLETEVARKIEGSLAAISGIRHTYTTISDGVVQTNIEFRIEKDMAEAMNEVRDALNRVRSDLPPEVRDPVFSKQTTAGQPILTYTVASAQSAEEDLSWFVDNTVSKAMVAVKGVGKFARIGGVEHEVLVELDPTRMAALNVSAAAVSRLLQQVQQEASGGRADVGGTRQSVRTIGSVGSVARIAALEIPLPDGATIRLDRVATVKDTHAERAAITLLDGRPVVGFEITRSKGAGELAVAQAVRAAVADLQNKNPQVRIEEAFNGVDAVADNYAGSMSLLYEGALLAVLVVWAFLRDWRATFISAAALPLSLIPTFFAMVLFGFTLNTVTLLSLALVVGILVDDAIVEIENIVRHLRMGKTPYQAALEAADEIGLAVVATTLTLVAVFLPTAFMSGVVGKFFRQFGWTASVAVAMSLVVARLLTPLMAAYLLKPLAHGETLGRTMKRYLALVSWCLNHRWQTAVVALVFFGASMALVPLLPSGFIPAADRAQTRVTIELPPGSTLDETRASAEQARRLLRQDRDVLQVFSAIGGDDMRMATLTVTLKPRAQRDRSQGRIESGIRDTLRHLPGTRVTVGSGGNGEELLLLLFSDDPQALADAAQAVQRDIRTIPGLGNITSSISLVRPEVIVTPDFARAADLGVTAAAIGETLRVATNGDYAQLLPKLNLPDRQLPIRVRLPQATRADLATLEQLTVPGRKGNVRLGNVATLRLDSGPARIDRLDRSRRVIIHVELNGQPLSRVQAQINRFASLKNLPPSVKRGSLGDAEVMQELFQGFALAMLTGVLCVYMVLVLLFRGFMHPVTILAALPLSIGGAFIALLLTHNAFSMPSLIGLLMLMGIAVKNSILLVEYTIVARRDHGTSRIQALLDACRKRSRPIVMTTIAMGAGMLPNALGLGADASFRGPLAIAVIGGLITSTFLSLLIIPVVFTYVDDLIAWTVRQVRKRRSMAPLASSMAPQAALDAAAPEA